jgi:hypothetical protein
MLGLWAALQDAANLSCPVFTCQPNKTCEPLVRIELTTYLYERCVLPLQLKRQSGDSRIRTCGALSGTLPFQDSTISHSVISPKAWHCCDAARGCILSFQSGRMRDLRDTLFTAYPMPRSYHKSLPQSSRDCFEPNIGIEPIPTVYKTDALPLC